MFLSNSWAFLHQLCWELSFFTSISRRTCAEIVPSPYCCYYWAMTAYSLNILCVLDGAKVFFLVDWKIFKERFYVCRLSFTQTYLLYIIDHKSEQCSSRESCIISVMLAQILLHHFGFMWGDKLRLKTVISSSIKRRHVNWTTSIATVMYPWLAAFIEKSYFRGIRGSPQVVNLYHTKTPSTPVIWASFIRQYFKKRVLGILYLVVCDCIHLRVIQGIAVFHGFSGTAWAMQIADLNIESSHSWVLQLFWNGAVLLWHFWKFHRFTSRLITESKSRWSVCWLKYWRWKDFSEQQCLAIVCLGGR